MSSKRAERVFRRRLRHPVTAGEFVGLAACMLLGGLIFFWGREFAFEKLKGDFDIGRFILYLALGRALPAFCAVLVGSIACSWRCKPIGATLLVFVLVGFCVQDFVFSVPHGFMAVVGSTIRFSATITGALPALALWRKLRERRAARKQGGADIHALVETSKPRTPVVPLVLCLVSIPAAIFTLVLSLFVTIGLSALFYFILADLDSVPVFLILAAILAPILALVSSALALGSVLRPRPIRQIGRSIALEAHPTLRRLLGEVSARVGSTLPDHVVLAAEPVFFVTQGSVAVQNGILKGRTLVMGLPLLKILTTDELAAVLAHELAHFSGRDTLYSMLAAPVYRGLQAAVMSMGGPGWRRGSATAAAIRVLQLPATQLLVAMYWYFHSLNMILSRRRELRADWVAAKSFGTDAHASALRKTSVAMPHYAAALNTITWKAPGELFEAYKQQFLRDEAELAAQPLPDANETESEFSSHPSTPARIASLPDFRVIRLSGAFQLNDELAHEEARVSEAFVPLVISHRERQAADQARTHVEVHPTPPADPAVSPEEGARPDSINCASCGKSVTPTFQGCCPLCGEFME